MRGFGAVAGLLVLGLSAVAHAEQGEAGPTLKLGGRFLASAEVTSLPNKPADIGLQNARLSLDARWDMVRAVLEADLASTPPLADAFVELRPVDGFSVRAGRFTPAFSFRQMQSRWDLPLIDRGMVNEAMLDASYGGRRPGVEARFKRKPWLGLTLQGGVFKSATPGEQDYAARASVRPFKPLTLGVNAYGLELGRGGTAMGADALVSVLKARLQLEALLLPRVIAGAPVAPGQTPPWEMWKGGMATLSRRFLVHDGEAVFLEPAIGAELLEKADEPPVKNGSVALSLGKGDLLRVRTELARGQFVTNGQPETRFGLQLGARY